MDERDWVACLSPMGLAVRLWFLFLLSLLILYNKTNCLYICFYHQYVGVFVNHSKKPKILKRSENPFDAPLSGSVASPVTSQMSNMSRGLHKFFVGRDRSRKLKALKVIF